MQSVGQNCTLAIDRIKLAPPDYKTIIRNQTVFTDSTFAKNNMVYWADNVPPDGGYAIRATYAKISSFERLFTRQPLSTMWGSNGINNFDTAQSQFLGDCYFISGILSISRYPSRVKNIFVIQEVNPSGLICFNIFIRGIPRILCIDDIIPWIYVNGGVIPAFAQIGNDGGLLGPLLEKMFAKINGNFERI